MKLGNVIEFVNEKIEARILNNYEYISTENMLPNFGGVSIASSIPSGKCTRFIKNDILISNIRPYFKKIWFAKFDGGCSNDVIVLRNGNSINPKYLYYAVANDKYVSYYNSSCKGTKMPRGNKDALLEWEFELPNIEIQQHIVNTIGSVDDLIEKNIQIINGIEALFKLLLDKYKKEQTTKFSKIFKCFNGGIFKSSDYINFSQEKLITIKNIGPDGFDTTGATYFKLNEKYKKYKLNISDILLTMTGAYLGRTGIVHEEDCYQNQRILKVECGSKAFCYAFLKNNEDTFFQLGRGSAQPNLSLEDLNNLDINYDSATIDNFKKYDYIFEKLLSLKIENKKLLSIKQKLLIKYF